MALGEFELIARYFSDIGFTANKPHGIDLAGGDDCALLTPPAGQQLALSVDTLVADVHFPANGDAYFIAQKALRCNLSDLAAMGAEPFAFTLALSLPQADEEWISALSRGLYDCAREFNIPLIGGDTTRSPTPTITIQVIGALPSGAALLRSGAKPGDAIFVSGTLGDARAALDYLALPLVELSNAQRFCLKRYYIPTPRVALGIALRGIAHSAIDVSDGLAADLGHILERSRVGAEIDLGKLPLSAALQEHALAREFATSGGDDYELCFTVAPHHKEKIAAIAQTLNVALTEIGCIVEGDKLLARDSLGALQALEKSGYNHFRPA